MPRSFAGEHDASSLRFGVIASRFNDDIVDGLLRGALECLERHGARDDAIEIYRVPGAFEIPTLARELISQPRFGFDAEKHPAYLTMALGAGSVTPLHFAAGAGSVEAVGALLPGTTSPLLAVANRAVDSAPRPVKEREK